MVYVVAIFDQTMHINLQNHECRTNRYQAGHGGPCAANAGIRFPAVFSYYATAGHLDLRLTGESNLPFVAPAYTAQELFELLPGGLEIDTQTPIAAGNGWTNLKVEEIRYRYAHLSVIKTPGDSYLCAYYYENRQIAFRKTTDGKAENLLVHEDSQAESLAQMVLKLVGEEKLPNHTRPVPEAHHTGDGLRITLETVLAPLTGNTLPETESLLERLTDHVYYFFFLIKPTLFPFVANPVTTLHPVSGLTEQFYA